MRRSLAGQLVPVLAPGAVALAAAAAGLLAGGYWRYVLCLTLAAAITGGALVMLVGFARCIMLASGAMMALGAYAAGLLLLAGWPFPLAVATAAALGGFGGLVLGVASVRFRSHTLAMVTLVFQSVVIIGLRQWRGLTNGAEGLTVPAPQLFGVSVGSDGGYLVMMGLGAAVALPLLAALLRGAFGQNLRALAGNEVGARAFGISVEAHLVAAFTISSAIVAFAAALAAPRVRVIDPDSFGIAASIFALSYPIIGGMGSVWGGMLGGSLMRLLPELLRPLADYIELLLSALVLGAVVFLPGGLVGGLLTRRASSDARAGATQPVIELPEPATAAPAAFAPAALQIERLVVAYDSLRAVDGVSFSVPQGAICGLIGPNGAGKTTLFNAVSGLVTPDAGRIALFGAALGGIAVHRRIGVGMARTFQQVAVFPALSCRDNVVIGLGRNGIGRVLRRSVDAALAGPATRAEWALAEEALAAVGLGGLGDAPAGRLSLGDQRRLEIARALVSRPRLMLLDEPVSGVAHEEAAALSALLQRINRGFGITMLIVEHDISFLVGVCDRLVAMAAGRVVCEGAPASVVADPAVRRLYFGELEVAG